MQKQTIENKKINNKAGFTLLEVVLVMFVVSLTFTGIYSVLASTSRHEKDNRYALVAANLAQEGVEIVRNKRDENLLEDSAIRVADPTAVGVDMNAGLSGTCHPYWAGASPVCSNSGFPQIEVDDEATATNTDDDVYRNCPSGGCSFPLTVFERECIIDDLSDPTEAFSVKCTVEWESPSLGTTKTVEMESLLTNWQQNL